MKIKEITNLIEKAAPLALQESYDNAGLIIGDAEKEATGALITLDVSDEVVKEAINLGINLIVAHHPLIFKGLKKINPQDMIGRLVSLCIKNDIAVYAAHTNLDNVYHGVNQMVSERLGLKNTRILSPVKEGLSKLVVFCPVADAEKVRQAIFAAGAGHIGNYDSCSFNVEGQGTFRALEGAQPYVGDLHQLHYEKEVRIEAIFPNYLSGDIIKAMQVAHPYEEVAYDIYTLTNNFARVGAGMIGELEAPENTKQFLARLKQTFGAACVRHSPIVKDKIQQVAVCGGSGSFLIGEAMRTGADIYITGDLKYHEFFDADGKILLADIGHYESEQFTKELLMNLIKKNFSNFAAQISGVNTNPVHYL